MCAVLRYLPVGDKALLVEFGNAISLEMNRKVHALDRAVSQAKLLGVEECVPTYRSLLVYYDPLETSYERLVFRLGDLGSRLEEFSTLVGKTNIEVPTIYGGEYGPDLEYVATYHNLGREEVVSHHSCPEYMVYMIGFIAGFPYLGEVVDELVTPRLKTPRLRVPAGSVGIAEKQTGIYPFESPSGWRIIGRTPISLFDPERRPLTLMQPGDTIKFRPIGEEEYRSLAESKHETL
ncbi:MAG: 5-oxoprolinase subunit PxpB [Candidatus Bathyarchaeota archaeon]|nr:MAG: 5-oxoprolinase subunit PxpB [Candidatus Bathyarchaeota archaeon]